MCTCNVYSRPSDPIKLYDLQQKPDLLIWKWDDREEGERKSLNWGEIGSGSQDVASHECMGLCDGVPQWDIVSNNQHQATLLLTWRRV